MMVYKKAIVLHVALKNVCFCLNLKTGILHSRVVDKLRFQLSDIHALNVFV